MLNALPDIVRLVLCEYLGYPTRPVEDACFYYVNPNRDALWRMLEELDERDPLNGDAERLLAAFVLLGLARAGGVAPRRNGWLLRRFFGALERLLGDLSHEARAELRVAVDDLTNEEDDDGDRETLRAPVEDGAVPA